MTDFALIRKYDPYADQAAKDREDRPSDIGAWDLCDSPVDPSLYHPERIAYDPPVALIAALRRYVANRDGYETVPTYVTNYGATPRERDVVLALETDVGTFQMDEPMIVARVGVYDEDGDGELVVVNVNGDAYSVRRPYSDDWPTLVAREVA